MTKIAQMLRADEGFSSKPYIDTQGYPTIGIGQRIGPKGASLSDYTFTISQAVSDIWMQEIASQYRTKIESINSINAALKKCNTARYDALLNMAYQMGTSGLAGFKNTLVLISNGNFSGAAVEMLNSLWAKQTPDRARRVSEVIRTGTYDSYSEWFR